MNRTALTRYLLAASLALNLGVVASLVIRTSVLSTGERSSAASTLESAGLPETEYRAAGPMETTEPAFLQALAANWQGHPTGNRYSCAAHLPRLRTAPPSMPNRPPLYRRKHSSSA